MSAMLNRKNALPARSHEQDAGYVIPERIVVDSESFDRLSNAIENPREPNALLISMFKKR